MTKPLVIVDITAVLFRMYFSGMSHKTPTGLEIGGVWGVCTTLRNLIREMKPKYFAAVFDAGQKTFRNELSPSYKANRGDPPDDLIPQFELSYQLCQSLGIHCFRMVGFEADDLMATLATISSKQLHPVQMVTVDKDLNQIVQDTPVAITRVNFFKKQVFTRDAVKESMGVYPESCNDFMALVGDSVDNISGVRGIGPKKAGALISRFGTLENLYVHLEVLKTEKKWKRIAGILEVERNNAFLSRDLVTMKKDINLSSQVIDIKEDLVWTGSGGRTFLRSVGLERYSDVLRPI